MKTQKRFNPKLLERFAREDRGSGILEKYQAWHKVSRGDPASRGRSHIQSIRGRQYDLLSDVELLFLMFAMMLPNVVDCREQFPLSREKSHHELSSYSIQAQNQLFPGTLQIAEDLSFKHPQCIGNDVKTPWVPTTDLLLTLAEANGEQSLLAISIKRNINISNRERQLLEIERTYWAKRDVTWILLVPSLCHPLIIDLLSCTRGWALSSPIHSSFIEMAVQKSASWSGHSLTTALSDLNVVVKDFSLSQHIFWQSVWSGKIRLDLRRGWRPQEPLKFLSIEDFSELNPIAMRRSAWI